MIDLHTHTDASDGTFTPDQLVDAAIGAGLSALAITDHDTFAGYDEAAPLAAERGLDLVCGIELNTKQLLPGESGSRMVHLLGYWPTQAPSAQFRAWLEEQQATRRERNERQVAKLRALGVDITLPEVQAYGRMMVGRPHFGHVLVAKGYAQDIEDAFRKYVGETAPGYVPRRSPTLAESIGRVQESGGIASLAHPVRLGRRSEGVEAFIVEQAVRSGLLAIEVFHSDHRPEDVERFRGYALRYGLLMTGGSDFHGDNKPDIQLGLGRAGNLQVSHGVLDELRAAVVG